MDMQRVDKLKDIYRLEQHPEGGWFSECYTSADSKDGRAMAGSIYFMLIGDGLSHFHEIDCEELWYHHEGCAVRITSIFDGKIEQFYLGSDIDKSERAMIAIPKGAIFAAENLDKSGYCFMSCATSPKFTYDGFRLVGESEIRSICGQEADKILYLAYSDEEIN